MDWNSMENNEGVDKRERDWDIEEVCMVTGHRVKKLFGTEDPSVPSNKKMLWALRELYIEAIEDEGKRIFLTGMATGIDLWAARILLKLKEEYEDIEVVGVIPCKNQTKYWSKKQKAEWQSVRDQIDDEVFVSEDTYKEGCMQDRNEWMVDRSSLCLGVFSGEPGGTANTLKYAKKQGVYVWLLNPYGLSVQKGI